MAHAAVRAAPLIPLSVGSATFLTAERLENFQWNAALGPLVAQAWLRNRD